MTYPISTTMKLWIASVGLAALTTAGLRLADVSQLALFASLLWLGMSLSSLIAEFLQFEFWSSSTSPQSFVAVMLSISLALLVDQLLGGMLTSLAWSETAFFSVVALTCIALMVIFGKRSFQKKNEG